MCSAHSSYPAQLSDDAIVALCPILPPLDSGAMTTHAAEAAGLQLMFADAAKDMQRAAVVMRDVWCRWQLLPVGIATRPVIDATAECQKSIVQSETRREEALIKAIYEKHKGAGAAGLSKLELIDALKDVGAPVLSTVVGSSAESLFRNADVFSKGVVDFQDFKRVANIPDDIELFLADHGLQSHAPVIRTYVAFGDDQLQSFSKLSPDLLHAAVDTSAPMIKRSLCRIQKLLKAACEAQVHMNELLTKQPGKFSIFKASGGTIDAFHKGLLHRIGSPSLDFEKAMRAEHCSRDGCLHTFTSPNYSITTQPRSEWLYIVGDDKGQRPSCPDMNHGRRIVPIDQLLKTDLAMRAALTRVEMIAVVLYSGPMFVIYNAVLRQYPENVYDVFRKSGNTFSTTIFVLVSAIQKLSRCMRIPPGTLLYRGLGGTMELPDSFSNADDNGCAGYTEYGFMSTTADRSVAIHYSGVNEHKPKASIMEIHPNSVDRGADISEFSQYPGEKEYLFVPCSFVQGEGRQRVVLGPGCGVLTVISVRVNINLKTETVEQLKGKKKSMHVAAFEEIIHETRSQLLAIAEDGGLAKARAQSDPYYDDLINTSTFISDSVSRLQAVKSVHSKMSEDDYVDDLKYSACVTRMLSAQAWAKQRLWLWLENHATNISTIQRWTGLQAAHRQWLSFLKQQCSVAAAKSDERRSTAVKVLQCKGLLVGDHANLKTDDEPLLFTASADSWAAQDVEFVIEAGADVHSVNSKEECALHAAVANSDSSVVRMLLKAGADPHQKGKKPLLRSPLHLACERGSLEILQMFFDGGADPNFCDGNQNSPLFLAAQAGQLDAVNALVAAKADLKKRNVEGRCPLYAAAANGRSTVIQALYSAKADIHQRDCEFQTPLWAAVDKGHASAVAVLVDLRADLGAFNRSGVHVMTQALKRGDDEIVSILSAAGAVLQPLELEEKIHADSTAEIQASKSILVSRHRGGGFVLPDYSLTFRDFNTFVADVKLSHGCFYFEVEIIRMECSFEDLQFDDYVQFGCCTDGFEMKSADHSNFEGVGDDAFSWAVDGCRQTKWHVGEQGAFSCRWKAGDVVGFLLDMQVVGSAVMSISVNGCFDAPNGVAFSDIDAPYLSPAFSGYGCFRLNFGDRPFAHGPMGAIVTSVSAFHTQAL